jgi:hypothetical protein
MAEITHQISQNINLYPPTCPSSCAFSTRAFSSTFAPINRPHLDTLPIHRFPLAHLTLQILFIFVNADKPTHTPPTFRYFSLRCERMVSALIGMHLGRYLKARSGPSKLNATWDQELVCEQRCRVRRGGVGHDAVEEVEFKRGKYGRDWTSFYFDYGGIAVEPWIWVK